MKGAAKEEIAPAQQINPLTDLASYQPQEPVEAGRHGYKPRTTTVCEPAKTGN